MDLILLGQDQETVTPDGKTLLTDTPEAIWAGEMYKSLLRDSAPPGVVGFNWNECQTSFMQGKVGMWMDGVGFTPPLLDPKVSKIVDHVGFGVMPAGPKAHNLPGVHRCDRHSGQEQGEGSRVSLLPVGDQQADVLEPGEHGRRRLAAPVSTYNDPTLMKNNPFGQEWLATLLTSLKIARVRPAGDRAGHRVPRRVRHRADQHDRRRRSWRPN